MIPDDPASFFIRTLSPTGDVTQKQPHKVARFREIRARPYSTWLWRVCVPQTGHSALHSRHTDLCITEYPPKNASPLSGQDTNMCLHPE
jgi:hypothetical protein